MDVDVKPQALRTYLTKAYDSEGLRLLVRALEDVPGLSELSKAVYCAQPVNLVVEQLMTALESRGVLEPKPARARFRKLLIDSRENYKDEIETIIPLEPDSPPDHPGRSTWKELTQPRIVAPVAIGAVVLVLGVVGWQYLCRDGGCDGRERELDGTTGTDDSENDDGPELDTPAPRRETEITVEVLDDAGRPLSGAQVGCTPVARCTVRRTTGHQTTLVALEGAEAVQVTADHGDFELDPSFDVEPLRPASEAPTRPIVLHMRPKERTIDLVVTDLGDMRAAEVALELPPGSIVRSDTCKSAGKSGPDCMTQAFARDGSRWKATFHCRTLPSKGTITVSSRLGGRKERCEQPLTLQPLQTTQTFSWSQLCRIGSEHTQSVCYKLNGRCLANHPDRSKYECPKDETLSEAGHDVVRVCRLK